MSEWSPTEAFSDGFEKLKANPVGLIVPVVVVAVIQGIPNGVFGGIAGALEGAAEGEGPLLIVAAGVRLLSMVVGLVISAFLTGGTMNLFLKAGRGQEYALGDVFGGGRFFVNMFILLFIMQIGTGIGFMLCIVPGVILALGLQMSVPLMVDRELGAIDALKESWRITTGHKMSLFVFGLLAFAVSIAGMLACCVGIFPAAAVIALAQVHIYLKLTEGEPQQAAPAVF